jgi:hypothetical protein
VTPLCIIFGKKKLILIMQHFLLQGFGLLVYLGTSSRLVCKEVSLGKEVKARMCRRSLVYATNI